MITGDDAPSSPTTEQSLEIDAGPARHVGQGALADAITTVSEIARPHSVPVAVRAHWDALARIGPVGAAAALARASAGAVVIPDLPQRQVDMWAAAAGWAGLLGPRVAFGRATDPRLATVCRAATGWVAASAAITPTGYPADQTWWAFVMSSSAYRPSPGCPS